MKRVAVPVEQGCLCKEMGAMQVVVRSPPFGVSGLCAGCSTPVCSKYTVKIYLEQDGKHIVEDHLKVERISVMIL